MKSYKIMSGREFRNRIRFVDGMFSINGFVSFKRLLLTREIISPGKIILCLLPLFFCNGCDLPADRPDPTAGPLVSVDNPYEGIDWPSIHFLHSASHQHGRPYSTPTDWHGRDEDRLFALYQQGLRHFALSNYNPSVPTYPFYPLPDELARNEDLIAAPNAEHRSPTDFSMHFNTLGSYYRSGYARSWEPDSRRSPYVLHFEDPELTVYNPETGRMSDGAYRLRILLASPEGVDSRPEAWITLQGGVKRQGRDVLEPAEESRIEDFPIHESDGPYLLFTETSPRLIIRFNPETTVIQRVSLTSRLHVPWRQAFREALDGDRVNEKGERVEGLQFKDGGGITINHPGSSDYRRYLELLDFDERVLGMEIWNHRRAFGSQGEPPHDRYYAHWDPVLKSGRRMFAFAVMDHRWQGRGRNVLLVPPPAQRTVRQQQQDALRAYRNGSFFAVVGALATDESGQLLPASDYTNFRFTLLEVEKNSSGVPIAIHARAEGQDTGHRPRTQIRFITDRGMEKVVDANQARFEIPLDAGGLPDRKYVRLEAMAYPETHLEGEPLTAEMIRNLSVYDLAMLHDFRGQAGGYDYFDPGDEPVGIVDMVFAQPIRFQVHSP